MQSSFYRSHFYRTVTTFSAVLFLGACSSSDPIDKNASVDEQYQTVCASCHDSGRMGAPTAFNAATWQPLQAKGDAVLLQSVLQGKGFMPAGGGCSNCEVSDYEKLIDYMASEK